MRIDPFKGYLVADQLAGAERVAARIATSLARRDGCVEIVVADEQVAINPRTQPWLAVDRVGERGALSDQRRHVRRVQCSDHALEISLDEQIPRRSGAHTRLEQRA